MSHRRSIGTILSSYAWNGNRGNTSNNVHHGDIEKKGYLVKQKNMRSRFFVLRRKTTEDRPARLEYYTSEKNFSDGFLPKKTYILKHCFNISRKLAKKNNVIGLYINKTCVGLITENEEELTEWLQLLQFHKNASEQGSKATRKDYEYVCQVKVLNRDLGHIHNLTGHHWLCYSDRFLTLVRVDHPETKQHLLLTSVRKCSSRDEKFILQMGRISFTGRGSLICQTEDTFTAKKIHSIIGSAMNNRRRISCVGEVNKRTQIGAPFRNEPRQSDSWPNERTISSSLKRKLNFVRQTHSDGDASPFCIQSNHAPDKAVKYSVGYLPMKNLDAVDRGYTPMDQGRTPVDCGDTPVDCKEKPRRPTTLSLSPSTETSSIGSFSLCETPMSVCSGDIRCSSSLMSEESHSLKLPSLDGDYVNPSPDVDYVHMSSPVIPPTPAPTPTSTPTLSGHYVDMNRICRHLEMNCFSMAFATATLAHTENESQEQSVDRDFGSLSVDTNGADQIEGNGDAGTTGTIA